MISRRAILQKSAVILAASAIPAIPSIAIAKDEYDMNIIIDDICLSTEVILHNTSSEPRDLYFINQLHNILNTHVLDYIKSHCSRIVSDFYVQCDSTNNPLSSLEGNTVNVSIHLQTYHTYATAIKFGYKDNTLIELSVHKSFS